MFLCPVRCLSVPFVASPFRSFRFHNGSRFRDSVPLRNRIPLGPLPQALSSYTLSFFHLPKVRRFPVFSSHLPKVCGVATSSRALCVSVSPATVAFPPSKGAQISRVFVPPTEGAWSRHIFESPLYPCFSSHRAFSTFQRCADFPCFRLTFRRCAESSLLRERPVSVFLQPPCVSHLPKVRRIPTFSSHLPKVRSFRCSRCNHFEKAGCALS